MTILFRECAEAQHARCVWACTIDLTGFVNVTLSCDCSCHQPPVLMTPP